MYSLARLFGTEKAVDNLLDKDNGLIKGFGGWIDDFSHTEEEKAAANQLKREWAVKQLDALSQFKVVQRCLAFSSGFAFIFCLINLMTALWVEALTDITIVDNMLEFVLSDFVVWPIVAVFSLYCTGGVIESHGKYKNDKK